VVARVSDVAGTAREHPDACRAVREDRGRGRLLDDRGLYLVRGVVLREVGETAAPLLRAVARGRDLATAEGPHPVRRTRKGERVSYETLPVTQARIGEHRGVGPVVLRESAVEVAIINSKHPDAGVGARAKRGVLRVTVRVPDRDAREGD